MPKCRAQKTIGKKHICKLQSGHKSQHKCKCGKFFGKGEPMIELDPDVAKCGVIGSYENDRKQHVCGLPMLHHGKHQCFNKGKGMMNGCGYKWLNEGEEDENER